MLNNKFDLAGDEAQYWHWSKYLDISYYSKGPLIAYVIKLFSSFFGDTVFGVRMGALFFTFLSGAILISFLTFEFGCAGLYSSLIFLSSLLFFQTGLVMTTDSLAFFFGLISSIAVYKGIKTKDSKWWILFGVAIGIGILGKYTLGIYLAGIWLYTLVFDRSIIKDISIATLVVAVCSSPILFWNYQHNWVNLAHNFTHITGDKTSKGFTIRFLFELIFGQIALLGTASYLAFLGIKDSTKNYKINEPWMTALSSIYLPGLVLILCVSFFKRIYANWPLPLYIPLVIVTAGYLQKVPLNKKLLNTLLGIQLFTLSIAFLFWIGFSLGIPGENLPTKKLEGWTELAQEVDQELTSDLRFVYVEDYGLGSELAFYSQKLKGSRNILVADFQYRRMNQFDIWNDAHNFKNTCGLIIINKERDVNSIQSKFRGKITEIKPYQTVFAGAVIRDLQFYRGCKFTGASTKQFLTF